MNFKEFRFRFIQKLRNDGIDRCAICGTPTERIEKEGGHICRPL